MRRNFRKTMNLLLQPKIVPVANPDIVMLGDSNTIISYFGSVPDKKWSTIVGVNLNAEIVNFGEDGRTTADYLVNDKLTQLLAYQAKYYIICFGLNDVKFINTTQFDADTRALISQIQNNTPAGIPILMTNVKVDYPNHYSTDRNNLEIKPFDDVKRAIATELGLHLIDVYNRFDQEIVAGNWDHRIRTTSIWDASEDAGKTVGAPDYWFNNIHYNIEGNRIVADEITKYFQTNNLTI